MKMQIKEICNGNHDSNIELLYVYCVDLKAKIDERMRDIRKEKFGSNKFATI